MRYFNAYRNNDEYIRRDEYIRSYVLYSGKLIGYNLLAREIYYSGYIKPEQFEGVRFVEVGLDAVPEEYREVFSDPLFEIELERFIQNGR